MKAIFSAIILLVAAPAVLCHSTFQQLWVDGVDQASGCARLPLNNNPVTSVSGNDIRCNTGTKPVASLCTVPAGGKVTVEMHAQPGDRSCSNAAIGGNHFGPVIVYLSKVSDAKTNVGDGNWFKVDQDGYDPSTKIWGTDNLNTKCGKRDFKVPANLAPGNYLLRAEAIALHVAGQSGGAQFYMTCYQINVTGSGTANPAGVKFPGAYKASDPGILIDIYKPIPSYTVPGPAVYTG
ncbi:glycoside hydrolase [Bisporella sp. PMI_857]|nr:glycoside hydrolase [Bisporella sp. PMI_857]